MSRPGIELGPPRWEASTLEKSHSNSLLYTYSEHQHMSARPVENARDSTYGIYRYAYRVRYYSVWGPLVGIGTPPPPLPQASVPPPRNQGGGGLTRLWVRGVGESQSRRLEIKLSTLWTGLSNQVPRRRMISLLFRPIPFTSSVIFSQ